MVTADQPPQHLTAGWEALERDDLRTAEELARNALANNPEDAESLRLLGSSLLYQNRFKEAVAPLSKALETAPNRGVGHRLGYCYLALGDFKTAERILQSEVEAYPDLVDAHNALGVALINQSRREEALAVFRAAARLAPDSAEANNNIASVLSELGRYEEALPYLQKTVNARPQLAEAHHNVGTILQSLKRHEEAITSFEKALQLAPRMSYTLSGLVWNKLSICRWDNLAAEVESLRTQVSKYDVPAAPLTFIAISPSAQEQRLCAKRHVREQLPARRTPLWHATRYRHERIRLAYLSADFSEHATGYLTAGLFELHDRLRFEVVGVSYGVDDGSPMRGRLARAFDRFVDAHSKGDEETAKLLREMEIDIVIDLKGHTTGARPGILCHRPAPIQVSYLGFPGTMGADFIDYIVADRFVLPEEQQECYSEKVAYLPDCYQVNDARRAIADRTPTRAEAGLPRSGFVFCCFNNNYKITPPVFSIWMRLLREIPGSTLWLLKDNDGARRNLQAAAQASGIDPARLVFAPRLAHSEHLVRHRLADLFLDTLPYNAHTTASDALWAGLPVLTCAGSAFAGRVAGSLLGAVGLGDLVTYEAQDYEAMALKLARAPRLLAELRAKLACNRMRAPLFDTDRFRRHLESAYRTMWETWQRGEATRTFAVDPIG